MRLTSDGLSKRNLGLGAGTTDQDDGDLAVSILLGNIPLDLELLAGLDGSSSLGGVYGVEVLSNVGNDGGGKGQNGGDGETHLESIKK